MRFAVCLTYVPDPDTVEVDPLTGQIDVSRYPFSIRRTRLRWRWPCACVRGDTVTALTVGPVEAEAVYGMRSPSEPITSCASGMNPVQVRSLLLRQFSSLRACAQDCRIWFCAERAPSTEVGENTGARRIPGLASGDGYHEFRYQRGTGAFSAPPRPRRTVRGRGDDASGVGHRSRRDAAAIRQPARTYAGQAGANSGAASSGFGTFAAGREFPGFDGTCSHASAPTSARDIHTRRQFAAGGRIAQIMSAGVTGKTEQIVEALLRKLQTSSSFLRERGFLEQSA